MQINTDQLALDYESYRMAHGSRSLLPYVSRTNGNLFIVKDESDGQVTMTGISDDQEFKISSGEFSAGYGMFFLDESIFLFGTEEEIASAKAFHKSVHEAIRACIYGKANLPVAA
jgi:hypothetical protein